MMPGTVAAGVQITARSGQPGSVSISGNTARPSNCRYFGFTGQIFPWKPPLIRFASTVAPTLPRRAEAPTTAIDCALKNAPDS